MLAAAASIAVKTRSAGLVDSLSDPADRWLEAQLMSWMALVEDRVGSGIVKVD